MIPGINIPFDYAANISGASRDELKQIFVFLVSYPLAGLLKRVPDNKPHLKNIFNISIGVFFLVGLFDLWSGLVLVLFDAIGTYLIAAYIEGPYMPWVGFTFLMGHMSISHLYRQFANSPQVIDITGTQMVMVMKLSAFCFNVWDGRQKESDLNDAQKDRMLKTLPHPLDYAGFVSFFPSLMAGPAFDYVDYERWLTTSMFELPPGTDPLKAAPTRKKRKIPRSGTPAMKKMAAGLIWLVCFLQFSNYFNPTVVLSKEYSTFWFPKKVFHLHMLNFVTRMKYYGIWTLTEGACILSGIGYKGLDPKTGKPDWSRLTNIKPAGVELAQNSHAYLGNWNINTNHWLRNYVYLRVTPKGKKPGFRASMATFVTSAFWHGFLPGYYMTFVLASFIQNVAKNSRRLLRPFVMTPDGSKPLPTKRYYDIFTWLVTQLAFTFTTTPFILLSIHDSMYVWAQNYGMQQSQNLDGLTIVLTIRHKSSNLPLCTPLLAKEPTERPLPWPFARTDAASRLLILSVPISGNDKTLLTSLQFYAIIGVVLCSAFLASPGKTWLSKKVKARQTRPANIQRSNSMESLQGATLGVPSEPGKEWDEMVEEVVEEVKRRRGASVGEGEELRAKVEKTLKDFGAGREGGKES